MAPRPADEGSLYARHAAPEDARYLSPIGLATSADGRELYVACENTGQLLVVDTARRAVVRAIEVGGEPFAVVPAIRDPRAVYVSLRRDDRVVQVDLDRGQVTRTFDTGDDPHGVALDAEGTRLFVANLGSDDLSLIDLTSGGEIRRLSTGRSPFGVAVWGERLMVSSQMTLPVAFRAPPVLELTTVDTRGGRVTDRRDVPGGIVGQGVALSRDGDWAVMALELPKNLLPETQIHQGWMVTYGVAVAETRPGGRVAFLLIDEPELYFPDPHAVAFSADGLRLFITSSGADTVTVIDWTRALAKLEAHDGRIGLSDAAIERLSRHLAASDDYVAARIPTGHNPKGLAVDGDRVYVANRLADTVTILDARTLEPRGEIDLGGPKAVTKLRRGARLFNYASISFQRQLSCATCHPETNLDGLVYDIAADGGMGRNLVDNRTLRGIAGTAPFKWSGKNPSLARQEGPRAAQLFFRSHGFLPDEVAAITAYLESIPLSPNRHRFAELNEFQRRGRELFQRGNTNDGRYIPVANRCITCHAPPYYSAFQKHDVGTRAASDDQRAYDTPQLNNLVEQAPFLHDGRCWALEEIWTVFNPDDTHGATNDLTKEQLNDLIEYLKVL